MSTARARERRQQALSVVVLALAAVAAIMALRWLGLLQPLELVTYDYFLRIQALKQKPSNRVAVIGAGEADLNRFGWPLPDEVLADVLERVAAAGPRAIGLDLYRDAAPSSSARLNAILASRPEIIVIFKLGEGKRTGVPAPAAVQDEARIGFADIAPDAGGIVRRGLLFLDDGSKFYESFALRLARRYLKGTGQEILRDQRNANHMKIGRTVVPPLEADDGGYVGLDAAGYQFLLDYGGGPTPFPTASISAVLEGDAPDIFRDRVVLIGVAAESVKDYFETPFSVGAHAGEILYGATIHAHAVDQLLRMALDGVHPLWVLPDWQEDVLIMLCGIAGALAGLMMRNPWRLALFATATISLTFATSALAMSGRLWLPVAPGLAMPLSAVLTTAYLSRREALQRAQLMQLLSKHVSTEVASELWERRDEVLAGDGRLHSQRMVATVLFSDIRGFTPVSERLDAQALMDWLNTYTGAMADIVTRHRGMVDKFIGDAVMALFGPPVLRSRPEEIAEDARSAVACALAMRERLEELNRLWRADGLPEIGIRIGIHTGEIVAGSIGSRNRMEYSVVGDSVNTAARLESLDKSWCGDDACRILVSEATRACLGGAFRAEALGHVPLKGKAQPVAVYRILGLREGEQDEDDPMLSRQPGLAACEPAGKRSGAQD